MCGVLYSEGYLMSRNRASGRAIKIKSWCTTAPMGAIVEYYRAFSDLGLHTGYVIHIYAYVFTYIYASDLEATGFLIKHNYPSVGTEKMIQPKQYYWTRAWRVNIKKNKRKTALANKVVSLSLTHTHKHTRTSCSVTSVFFQFRTDWPIISSAASGDSAPSRVFMQSLCFQCGRIEAAEPQLHSLWNC